MNQNVLLDVKKKNPLEQTKKENKRKRKKKKKSITLKFVEIEHLITYDNIAFV